MKKRGGTSFRRQLLMVLLCIAVPLALLLAVSSFYSVSVFNGKIADSNGRTVDFCAARIEDELNSVDETLTAMAAGSSDFITLSGGTKSLQAYLSSFQLFNQMKTAMPSYSGVGAFFIYSVPSDVERDFFTIDRSYEKKEEIRKFVRQAVAEDAISYNMGWKWAQIGEESCLFRFFGGRGTYMAVMVPLGDLVNSSQWKLEGEAVAAFATREGLPLTQQDFLAEKKIQLQADWEDGEYFLSGRPARYMVIQREIPGTDCRLVFLVGGVGYLETLTPLQLALLVLSLLAVAAIPLFLLWANSSIIKPVEEIKGTMERIRAGDLEAKAPVQGQLLEFQEMNETFNTMMQQIKELKISAYEREIETQKAELRYLQLQIRPHFFLNCLKSLYALAQQKDYKRIQRMILAFSNHIRYIFGDSLDLVPLNRELEHIRNFLEIQGISSVHPPACTIDADERLLELPIPPLSLQTFVENSVKHESDPDHALEIQVKATLLSSEGTLYADLSVSDNGSGFPPEMLREINAPQPEIYARNHVGINNVKKRMSFLYGEDVLYAFFNSGHGSVSEILIPVGEHQLPKKGEEKGEKNP